MIGRPHDNGLMHRDLEPANSRVTVPVATDDGFTFGMPECLFNDQVGARLIRNRTALLERRGRQAHKRRGGRPWA